MTSTETRPISRRKKKLKTSDSIRPPKPWPGVAPATKAADSGSGAYEREAGEEMAIAHEGLQQHAEHAKAAPQQFGEYAQDVVSVGKH
jgi:hypothetical protein